MRNTNRPIAIAAALAATLAVTTTTSALAEEGASANSAERPATPTANAPRRMAPMPYGGMPPYGMAPPAYYPPYGMMPPGASPYGPPMGYAPPSYGPNQYNAPGINPSFNPPTMEPPWGNNKSFDMSPMKFWPVPGTGNPWHYKPWEPGAPWGDSGKFSDPPDEAFHEAEDFLADAPRMPGGWELPNISMPSPFEIGEQVGDQSWLLPENFKMRDRKRPNRYRKYFQNEN